MVLAMSYPQQVAVMFLLEDVVAKVQKVLLIAVVAGEEVSTSSHLGK